jgi:diguanylate cyclase (GGDEF)-like protein
VLYLQNDILRLIAKGESLDHTARALCRNVERTLPGVVCTIITVDRAGVLHPLAAPSLPPGYAAALNGLMIGPDVGACGAAAYFRHAVCIGDLQSDPRCIKYRPVFLACGLKACWSLPVCDDSGAAICVIALYFRENRAPTTLEQSTIEACVDLCELALGRHARVLDRERRATVDALTGLPNRAAFDAGMAHVPCEEPGSWGLFIVDLDNLKIVNDTFGHQAGDALIREAGSRITRQMYPDVTFRLGGDEFAVLIQSPLALADLDAAARRIFQTLETRADCDGHAVVPQATIGGAILGPDEMNAAAVHQNADFALYHAKETGRGGFVRYWPGIGTRITDRRRAVREVTAALAEGRIDAHYQPVVRLSTGQIVGVESLCRLITKHGQILEAREFHEATCDAHVATELTNRMLFLVARDMRMWLDAGIPVQSVGVNVSTADFYAGSLRNKLFASFGAAGVALSHLVLEVSEDVYLGQRDRVVAHEIKSLRESGLRVALDDFGTGFASLTHLLTVPVDILKIDQSFVARLSPGDPSTAIVEGLIDTARKLGVRVVAEGIETAHQAGQLLAMGCELGQGFAFSRAVDRHAMTSLLNLHVEREGAPPMATTTVPELAPDRTEEGAMTIDRRSRIAVQR